MLTTLIMFLILLSGSLIGSVCFHRKFEELLPITCIGIVCTLFVFGLVGHLIFGVYFVLSASAIIVIFTAVHLFTVGSTLRRQFISLFLTPAFFLFISFFVLFHLCYFGLFASHWDEFSCWMDHVKIMSYIDDFMTHPSSNASFVSYPPGMELFLYFFQKLRFMLSNSSVFSEWRAYLCYHLFAISLLFPFLKNWTFRSSPIYAVVFALVFLIFPLPFFSDYLFSLYIDPVVAILAGCGFSAILLWDLRDSFLLIFISLICAMLVLSKDIGLYFAVFIAIAWFCVKNTPYVKRSGEKYSSLSFSSIAPLLCAIVTKLLWKNELIRSQSHISFGNNIDFFDYTKMFFFNTDDTYRQIVVNNFKDAIHTYTAPLGILEHITYFGLLCVFMLLFFALARGLISHEPNRSLPIGICLVILAVSTMLYIYAMGATYVYNFSEYEAINLASFGRYICIAFLCCWLVLILSALHLLQITPPKKQTLALLTFCVTLILLSPTKALSDFLDRGCVRASINVRYDYRELSKKIQTVCTSEDTVCFISQADSGFDFQVVRHESRPIQVSYSASWSIGYPFFDGDIWTSSPSVEEFRTALLTQYVNANIYLSHNSGK